MPIQVYSAPILFQEIHRAKTFNNDMQSSKKSSLKADINRARRQYKKRSFSNMKSVLYSQSPSTLPTALSLILKLLSLLSQQQNGNAIPRRTSSGHAPTC